MGRFDQDNNSRDSRDFGRRDFRKRSFGDRDRGARREMHKAICDECGKECEVPFEPTSGKPIYCSDCFEKRDGGRPSGPRNFSDRGGRDRDRGPRRPDFDRRPDSRESRPHNSEQLEAINQKLDKLLNLLTTLPIKEEKKVEPKIKEVKAVEKKKIKVVKKKSAAK